MSCLIAPYSLIPTDGKIKGLAVYRLNHYLKLSICLLDWIGVKTLLACTSPADRARPLAVPIDDSWGTIQAIAKGTPLVPVASVT
jgi:hypothetical protein